MSITANARITVNGDDREMPGTFGYGCVLLLEGVEAEHSLNRAAKRLGMAYSKAWRLVKEAEGQLGVELLDRDGARGSTLTPEGKQAVEGYHTLQAEVDALLECRAPELFAF